MPELPEVETVRRALESQVIGLKVLEVAINYEKILSTDVLEFKEKLKNKTFTQIKRVGKVLIFILEDIAFTSHLKMEGKYNIMSSSEPFNKHEHVIFKLSNGFDLRYQDFRKFGRIKLKQLDDIYNTHPINAVGKEVFDETLKASYLKEKYNKKKAIKTILLDQSIMAGLGNIYADEVLFKSKINPLTLGKDLSIEDCENIIKYSKEILAKSIEVGGTSIRTYTSGLNVIGHYQDYLLVHTKEYSPCTVCNEVIIKIKVNGRGTYYCPVCQRPKA